MTTRLQIQHLAADKRGHLGETRHRQRPQNRVGLDLDVVVHEQNVLAGSVVQRLVHDAAVATGPTEVRLIVDRETATERSCGLVEAGFVLRLAGTLIRHDHGLDHVEHQRVRAKGDKRFDGVGRSVECGDTHGDGRLTGSVDRRVPTGTLEDHLGVGGDVEPDPPAVLERAEVDQKLLRRIAVHGLAALDVDARRIGLGPVDVDPAVSGDLDTQHHGLQDAVAPPVARRERVEVGAERHLRLRADRDRGSRERVCPFGVGEGFFEIQRADVERFAGTRQQHSLEKRLTENRRDVGDTVREQVLGGHLSPARGAPVSKCGARVFSYMFSALAMAMCMSRYW